MSGVDHRPPLRYEIVLRAAGDERATVIAKAASESDAKAIARSLVQKYAVCTVTIREGVVSR